MLTIDKLENCFKSAIEEEANFIGVLVQIENNPSPELIAFPMANYDNKLDYYRKVYNKKLIHEYNQDIKITGFTHADSLKDIEDKLF